MSSTLTVEAKVLGQRKPLITDWHVPFPPDQPLPVTLRELIEAVVRAEVAAFSRRQEERRLLQVLSAEQIAAGAARGKVDSGGREASEAADPDAAVARALQAFEDGAYFVFLDEIQHRHLEDAVELRSESRMLFLRLVALAGG